MKKFQVHGHTVVAWRDKRAGGFGWFYAFDGAREDGWYKKLRDIYRLAHRVFGPKSRQLAKPKDQRFLGIYVDTHAFLMQGEDGYFANWSNKWPTMRDANKAKGEWRVD